MLDIDDIYLADTDVEEDCTDDIRKTSDEPLKPFFQSKHFHIDKKFKKDMVTKLNRYIVAYKG